MLLRLRLIAKGTRLYQLAVLGKPEDLSTNDLETFFDSFALREPGD